MQDLKSIMSGQICPYCNCSTELVDDKAIYGPESNYGRMFLRCIKNHDHYVGTYRSTGLSLGRLADNELRRWKMEGHKAFDGLWNGDVQYFKSRQSAYEWLSEEMNLPSELTHFGMFDIEQCKMAIQKCINLKAKDERPS